MTNNLFHFPVFPNACNKLNVLRCLKATSLEIRIRKSSIGLNIDGYTVVRS